MSSGLGLAGQTTSKTLIEIKAGLRTAAAAASVIERTAPTQAVERRSSRGQDPDDDSQRSRGRRRGEDWRELRKARRKRWRNESRSWTAARIRP